MVISRIQPFLLLLLLSLFFLPALVRSAEFENCEIPLIGKNVIHVDSLEISPDSYNSKNPRTGTFTLKATYLSQQEVNSTEQIEPNEVTVHLDRIADFVTYYKRYQLCDVTVCPVKPGPLTFTFTDVFSAGPQTKPYREDFHIQIIENKLPFKSIMCIYFTL